MRMPYYPHDNEAISDMVAEHDADAERNRIEKEEQETAPIVYISCPFCHETDFDLIGLRLHLLRGRCETFNNLDPDNA